MGSLASAGRATSTRRNYRPWRNLTTGGFAEPFGAAEWGVTASPRRAQSWAICAPTVEPSSQCGLLLHGG